MKNGIHLLAVIGFACAASLILQPAYGAGISISGTVKDADGKAIGGADVYSVEDAKIRTVTANDGSFTLSGAVPEPTAAVNIDKSVPVTRTPVAASKEGYMTAQILSPSLNMKDMQFKLYPAIVGASVTLMGNRMNETHLREEAEWDPKGGAKGEGGGKIRFVFMIAFDGPPGIKAEVEQIWNDYYPGSSLDGDQAKELEDQFKKRMMFYIDGPLVDAKIQKAENYGPGTPVSVTGTISEKDGKKYITATAFGNYGGPKYPDRITAPLQPVVKLPVKPGLTIKLTDTLTDTLIYVPAGKFYMGSPLQQLIHWQEAPSHMVTFSKGLYVSDHPILNSEYAAVTGDANCNPKKYPEDAAVNISCEMFDKYVKALEKLNPGKVIRTPAKSEWEYFARCGNSDMTVGRSQGNRYGEVCSRNVAVKSRKPNAWGFYGIVFDDGSERSSDAGFFSDHVLIPAATDPKYPTAKCKANPAKDHIHANGGTLDFPIQELLNDNSNVGRDAGGAQRNNFQHIRQRIVVEE